MSMEELLPWDPTIVAIVAPPWALALSAFELAEGRTPILSAKRTPSRLLFRGQSAHLHGTLPEFLKEGVAAAQNSGGQETNRGVGKCGHPRHHHFPLRHRPIIIPPGHGPGHQTFLVLLLSSLMRL